MTIIKVGKKTYEVDEITFNLLCYIDYLFHYMVIATLVTIIFKKISKRKEEKKGS